MAAEGLFSRRRREASLKEEMFFTADMKINVLATEEQTSVVMFKCKNLSFCLSLD